MRKNKEPLSAAVGVRFSPRDYKKIADVSERTDIPISALVRRAMHEYLDNHETVSAVSMNNAA